MSASDVPATGTHVIVVTLGDCDIHADHPGEPHDDDCYERSVECPGVTRACEIWEPCAVKGCSEQGCDDDTNEMFHGVEHRYLRHDGGWWGVPQGVCFYVVGDHTCDAISELDLNRPGRYPIGVDIYDEATPVFTLIKEKTDA